MNRIALITTWTLAIILSFAIANMAAITSANYNIPSTVLSGGGTTTDSTSYQMINTIGQSSAIGLSSKGNYLTYAGIWHPSRIDVEEFPWILFYPAFIRKSNPQKKTLPKLP